MLQEGAEGLQYRSLVKAGTFGTSPDLHHQVGSCMQANDAAATQTYQPINPIHHKMFKR
jgi:hypothetical protein